MCICDYFAPLFTTAPVSHLFSTVLTVTVVTVAGRTASRAGPAFVNCSRMSRRSSRINSCSGTLPHIWVTREISGRQKHNKDQ